MAANSQSIPIPALVLGLGGLIPFILPAMVMCLPHWSSALINSFWPFSAALDNAVAPPWLAQRAAFSLGAYAAIILSFLGGVRWGNLLDNEPRLWEWVPLTLSVVPSLIAWPALLLPPLWMLSILAAGLVLQYALDVEALRRKEIPVWFGKLRLILTTGAILSLLVALLSVTLR